MEALETETVQCKHSSANSCSKKKVIYTLLHGLKITVNYFLGPCQIHNVYQGQLPRNSREGMMVLLLWKSKIFLED